MTRGPIWGNRNRTKKSQNLKSSSELTYRMQARSCLYANTQLRAHRRAEEKKIKSKTNKINKE